MKRGLRLAMRHLVRRKYRKPTDRVAHPRDQEEEHECQAERMLIEAQDPAAAPDGPGRVRSIGEVARIGVDQFRDTRSSRFG